VTRRPGPVLIVFGVLLVVAALARLAVGDTTLGLPGPGESAVWELRLLRLVAGVVVGGSLAVAGVMLQSVLRNPLASPDLLGLASGASLLVALTAFVSYRAGVQVSPFANPLAALVGSLATLGAVYALAQRRGLVEPISLILVGVIVSILCAAGTTLLHAMLPPDPAHTVMRWLFGSLSDETTWTELAATGGVLVLGIAGGLVLSRAMDAAAFSDDEARSVGVGIARLRLTLFLVAGMLTASSVVLAGPIGFVGLVCPHVVRLAAGPSHRPLLIGSALAGAALVVASDALVKGVRLESGRAPIGVVTALVGGPVFIVLLRRTLRG